MLEKVPVVYCFDKAYAPYAAVSTYSLILNSRSKMVIYWVVRDFDVDFAEKLAKSLFEVCGNITVVGVSDNFRVGHDSHAYISLATYLRLAIPYVISEEKVIYIDSDTLVLDDIFELYDLDMCGTVIGGAIDRWRGGGSKMPLKDGDPYINSGVMLMNLNMLRGDDFLNKCKSIGVKYNEFITGMDQCIINKYAEGRKIEIDKKWNIQILSNQEIWGGLENNTIETRDHAIVHFLGSVKPWQDWCDPSISDFWWGYAKRLEAVTIKPQNITNVEQALLLLAWIRSRKNYGNFANVKKLKHLKPKYIAGLVFVVCRKSFNKLFQRIFN